MVAWMVELSADYLAELMAETMVVRRVGKMAETMVVRKVGKMVLMMVERLDERKAWSMAEW